MNSQHKITLTKQEFQQYLKQGILRVEADFYVGNKVVKHCKAPLIFEIKKKEDSVELTFAGLD